MWNSKERCKSMNVDEFRKFMESKSNITVDDCIGQLNFLRSRGMRKDNRIKGVKIRSKKNQLSLFSS